MVGHVHVDEFDPRSSLVRVEGQHQGRIQIFRFPMGGPPGLDDQPFGNQVQDAPMAIPGTGLIVSPRLESAMARSMSSKLQKRLERRTKNRICISLGKR